MAKKPLESAIEDEAVAYAHSLGMATVKLDKCGRNNPDQLFFASAGHHFVIEFKREGETVRKGQARRIEQLRQLGHTVFEDVDTITLAERIIDREHQHALLMNGLN